MAQCETSSLYSSLNWCSGTTVLPGIRKKVYYISKSNVVTYPTLPDVSSTGASMSSIATYTGNFVLAADTTWLELDVLSADSPVTTESQGDIPSRTFLNKATFVHPGVEADASGFARMANSDDMLFLVQQKNGKFRLIGNEMFDTDTKVGQELGAGVSDKAGTTLTVEVTDVCPSPFYAGVIETASGNISGVDGSAIVEEDD